MADTQFHAVTTTSADISCNNEADSADEPPLLPVTKAAVAAYPALIHYYDHNTNGTAFWPGAIRARAPPRSQSQSLTPVV